MNDKQTKGYWRRWQAACKANAWREQKGYLTLAVPKSEPAEAVVMCAVTLADRAHRAVTLRDLRHGVHVAALSRDIGHDEIRRNADISRVYALLELLADPLNLDALNRWNNPEVDADEREKAFIRNVPAAYVAGCVEKMTGYETRDWESLSPQNRRALIIILSNARDRWQKPMVGV